MNCNIPAFISVTIYESVSYCLGILFSQVIIYTFFVGGDDYEKIVFVYRYSALFDSSTL